MDARVVGDLFEGAFFALNMGLAALVVAVAPRARINRLLAFYLLWNGLTALSWLETPLAREEVLAYNVQVLSAAASVAAPWAYVLFVAHAIDLPLLRPLRTRRARHLLASASIVGAAATFALHASIMERTGSGWDISAAFGRVYYPAVLSVVLAALALSLVAYQRAPPGSPLRRRAGAYALAFGLQDTGLAGYFLLGFLDAPAGWWSILLGAVLLASLVALTIALLRFQLFDFDLRVKWTLRRGTLVGVFVAVFFVVAAVVEQWLQQYGVLVGGVAVGLLLFALRPVERLADRLAERAMPGVQDTPEYRTVKKREVYRAAVEGALQDGSISEKERDVLARVADELGLTMTEALEIERDARAMLQPDAAPLVA